MARKWLFFLTVATATMISLDAAVWESNALAMKLSPLDEIPMSGYYIIEENGKETLFEGGKAVRVKEQFDGGYMISEDGRTTTVMLDAAGRPVSRDDGTVVVRNVYSGDGLLLSSTETGEDGLERICHYRWSPEGELLYVESFDASYYFSPQLFSYYSSGVTSRLNEDAPESFVDDLSKGTSTVTSFDDEVVVIDPSGNSRTYSSDGFLIGESRPDGTEIAYSYDDSGLLETERIRLAGSETVSFYSGGVLERTEYFQDDVLSRIRFFLPDGTMREERYRKGEPYASILYDRDHATIRSIESL